jgi:hypothetical protein
MKDFPHKELKTQIEKIALEIKEGRLVSHINGMVIAVFRASKLDGGVHIGWHYVPSETRAGDRGHYDHGVGIHKNKDAEYIWVAPLTKKDFTRINKERDFATSLPRNMYGLLIFEDGRYDIGMVVVDVSRVGMPAAVSILCHGCSNIESVVYFSQLPSEHLDVWLNSDNKPNDGDEVMSWDAEKARTFYSGPYWNHGRFELKAKNYRYQNYNGPMIDGLPWVSQDKWQSISFLKEITYGDYFVNKLAA